MIYEITKEVATDLRAMGVPFPVVYGPEASAGLPERERIVVQRAPDQLIPAPGGGGDQSTAKPKNATMAVNQGVTIRIFARSPAAGARHNEHERRAEHARDRVLVAFERVVRLRQNRIRWTRSEYVRPEDVSLDQTAPWVGVVYELGCFIDRGVFDRTWPTSEDPQGAALETVIIGTDVELVTPAPPEVN